MMTFVFVPTVIVVGVNEVMMGPPVAALEAEAIVTGVLL